MRFHKEWRTLFAWSLAVWGINTSAATISQSSFDQLLATAKQQGAVSVTVTVEAASLDVLLSDRLPALRSRASAKAQSLKAELGQTLWSAGQWDNQAGKLGMYVTEDGLRILRNSGNAIST